MIERKGSLSYKIIIKNIEIVTHGIFSHKFYS